MEQKSAEIVTPYWDVIDGTYRVQFASVAGLGDIEGETEEALNEKLSEILPDRKILVEYEDHVSVLEHN